MTQTISRLFLVTVTSLLIACSTAAEDKDSTIQNESEKITAEIKAKNAELEALIGDASCNTSQQCQSLAVGHKPCGGPSYFLPYSTKGLKQDEISHLEALARESSELSKRWNELNPRLSNCMLEQPPVLVCLDNRCQTANSTHPVM